MAERTDSNFWLTPFDSFVRCPLRYVKFTTSFGVRESHDPDPVLESCDSEAAHGQSSSPAFRDKRKRTKRLYCQFHVASFWPQQPRSVLCSNMRLYWWSCGHFHSGPGHRTNVIEVDGGGMKQRCAEGRSRVQHCGGASARSNCLFHCCANRGWH